MDGERRGVGGNGREREREGRQVGERGGYPDHRPPIRRNPIEVFRGVGVLR